MAKFFGVIGYAEDNVEISPGHWDNRIIERQYYGDIVRDMVSVRVTDEILPGINISNLFSIIADPYALDNISAMRYIHYSGANWNIVNVENQRPRLLIRPGGVYNGPTPAAPDDSGDDSGDP